MTFLCKLDAAAFAACTSPQAYTGARERLAHLPGRGERRGRQRRARRRASPGRSTDPAAGAVDHGSPANPTNTTARASRSPTPRPARPSCASSTARRSRPARARRATRASPPARTPSRCEAKDAAGNIERADELHLDDRPHAAAGAVDHLDAGEPDQRRPAPSFSFTDTEAGVDVPVQARRGRVRGLHEPDELSPALAAGSHTFQVEAKDAAGNTDAAPDDLHLDDRHDAAAGAVDHRRTRRTRPTRRRRPSRSPTPRPA